MTLAPINKVHRVLLAALSLVLFSLLISVSVGIASAAPIPAGCPGSTMAGPPGPICDSIPVGCPGSTQQGSLPAGFDPNDCPYDAPTGTLSEPNKAPNDCTGANLRAGAPEGDADHCGIIDYIVVFINALSALATLAIVAMIIYGGIQYSSAGSDPQKVSAAKNRIRNALLALVFFIFGIAILNWLVPGGVL